MFTTPGITALATLVQPAPGVEAGVGASATAGDGRSNGHHHRGRSLEAPMSIEPTTNISAQNAI